MTAGLWLECVGGPEDGERFPASAPPAGYVEDWVQYRRYGRKQGAVTVAVWVREWGLVYQGEDDA